MISLYNFYYDLFIKQLRYNNIVFNFKPRAYWTTENKVTLEEKTLKLRYFPK